MTTENGTVASVVQGALASMEGAVAALRAEHVRLVAQRSAVEADLTATEEALTRLGGAVETPAAAPRRGAGRPRGSRNASTTPRARRNSGTPGGDEGSGDSPRRTLPVALSQLFEAAGPLNIADIVTRVRSAPISYESNANDAGFTSIVQQALGNHLAQFSRDGAIKVDGDGNIVGKGDRVGMFVRVARGVYDNARKSDTLEKIERRGARIEKAADAAAPAAA